MFGYSNSFYYLCTQKTIKKIKIMDREQILSAIRKIVGGKTFEFSEAYVKHNGNTPTIGNNGIHYGRLTRTYLYAPCWGRFEYDEEEEMYGWYFCKLPIMRYTRGERIKKVQLEEMFTRDLKKILDDLIFYFWWETEVHFKSIEKEYNQCKAIVEHGKKFQDLLTVKES